MTRVEALRIVNKLARKLDKMDNKIRALDVKKGKLQQEIAETRRELDQALKRVENPPKDEQPRVAVSFADRISA